MTTRREYAISLGLATPGRGRMSREAHAAIEEAEAEGKVFSDPKPVTKAEKIAARESVRPAPRKAVVVQTEGQKTAEPLAKPFTGTFRAVMPDGTRKKLSDRTACQCGASLSFCYCKVPTVGLLIVDPLADDVEATVNIERV
jgi:hypothetical protein